MLTLNLCTTHIITAVISTPNPYFTDSSTTGSSQYSDDDANDKARADGDNGDDCADPKSTGGHPLRRARNIIRILWSSDECRRGFCTFIQNGNKVGIFGHPIPELELLRDVKTRWDSVFLMVDRLRTLRVVSVLSMPTGQVID